MSETEAMTSPVTPDPTAAPLDVAALAELLDLADAAPWCADWDDGAWLVHSKNMDVARVFDKDDALLFCAARNQLPALLSAVASLTQERDELANALRIIKMATAKQVELSQAKIAAARKQAKQAQAEIAHLTRERDEVLLWVSPQTKVTFAEQWAAKRATSVPQPKGADHPERTCGRCGGPNIPWAAPSPLWNEVMRSGDINATDTELHHGIVCPTCFAVLAEQAGVAEIWRLYPVRVLADLKTVTPSGRVWNEQTWLWEEPAAAVPSSGGQDTAADEPWGEEYTTGSGQKLRVHAAADCRVTDQPDVWCVIHRRKPGITEHWATHWRGDRRLMEVLCPHGVGHPAPERIGGDGTHGCDGCCTGDGPATAGGTASSERCEVAP